MKLFLAIPVNLTLWNGETWAGNLSDLKLLDVFYHKAIRRILRIRMLQIKDERISNSKLRAKILVGKSLSEIWRFRLLKFIGRTVRQDVNSMSRACLTLYIKGN